MKNRVQSEHLREEVSSNMQNTLILALIKPTNDIGFKE